MSDNYYPEGWVTIRVQSKEDGSVIYRIFATERAGYGGDDTWKLSSGFKMDDLTLKEDHLLARQISGNTYNLHYAGECGYTSSTFRILLSIMEKMGEDGYLCEIIRNLRQHKLNPPLYMR
jgi:hypothetical protein